MTVRSATRSTVKLSWRVGSGNTSRAMWLPNGSCCQLMKWFSGSTVSEYDSTDVRVCGAGRSRTTWGERLTGRSKR